MSIKHSALLALITVFTSNAQDIAYLFSHGLGADKNQAYYYKDLVTFSRATQSPQWIIQEPLFTFNFPDAMNGYDRSKTSLGQKNEIAELAKVYRNIKNNTVVLMGISRGASTILNFLGTNALTNVAAAIVESPFDSIINLIDNHASFSWVPGFIRHAAPEFLFGELEVDGIAPIKVIDKIRKDIPILFVASLQDTLIAASCTASLYLKLLEKGHEHVYFVLLNHGKHVNLLEAQEAAFYVHAVHAFYQKYDLPHDSICAQQGQKILEQCRPSKKVVERALRKKKSFIVHQSA